MENQNQTPMPSGIIPYGLKIHYLRHKYPWHPKFANGMPDDDKVEEFDEYCDYQNSILGNIIDYDRIRKVSIYNVSGCNYDDDAFCIDFDCSPRKLAGYVTISKEFADLWLALQPLYGSSRLGIEDDVFNMEFKLFTAFAEAVNKVCINYESRKPGSKDVTWIVV